MIKNRIAKKLLTKAEQDHLTEMGINSMAAMKRQSEFIKKDLAREKETGTPCFTCWKCRDIANKLGL